MPESATQAARPLVSVLIPTYNHARYLPSAIADALGQRHTPLEVLVGDDASPDDTAVILAGITDPRLTCRRRATNLGAAANLRLLLGEARGKYIGVLNDDDRWAPELVSRLIEPLESDHSLVCAFSRFDVIDAEGRLLAEQTAASEAAYGMPQLAPGRHQPFAWEAASKGLPSNLCTIFRRSAVRPEDISDDVGAAYDLWLSYLLCRGGDAVWFSPDKLATFRVHSDSTTSLGGTRLSSGEVAVYRRLLADGRLEEHREELRRRSAAVQLLASRDRRRAGDRAGAIKLLAGSIRTRPTLGAVRQLGLTVLGR